MAKTELWSYDKKKGRSLNVTIEPSQRNHSNFDFQMLWSDGSKVDLPIELTAIDIGNLIELLKEVAQENDLTLED